MDDDPRVREMVLCALQGAGFDVEEASDGIQALVRLWTTPFDAVVTDLQMPRLDGLGLLHRIRRREKALPVVIQTTLLDSSLEHVLCRSGAFRVLKKGASPADIIRAVTEACAFRRDRATCCT